MMTNLAQTPGVQVQPSRFVRYSALSLICACIALVALLVEDGIRGHGLESGIGAFCVAPILAVLAVTQVVALFRRSRWAAWSVAAMCFVCCIPLLPVAVSAGPLGLVAFAAFSAGAVANVIWARNLRRRPGLGPQGFPVLPPRR